ncbi:MAG: Guanylate kinase [Firmicutes bacterium]|nr:Guanylate kinase [Bacillota bacterium]MDI6705468.1 guanylate kinase [Bacillota bacterium]
MKMAGKGLLVVVSGPSGAGKGTICKNLLDINKDIVASVSATTRMPREGELNGKNYFFVSRDKFEQMIADDDFIEYAVVYDNYYGTPRRFVEENLENGKDVLLEIDIQGALQVKDRYREGVFVFILPPSMEELKNRIIKRGTESEREILKRFEAAYKEINFVSRYNYFIINDKVDEATEKLRSIIIAEKCRVDRFKMQFIGE